MRLGTSLCQLSARTPTAMGMAALTMDHLSSGRFVLGLGVSGPQVVEGWYGQPFPKPLARTREYVDIVRQVLARQGPGDEPRPPLPAPLPGGTGLGKPLKPIVHPLRADIPIILGAEGPKNVALAAEIADGWFPIFFSPRAMGSFESALAEGFARPGARRRPEEFEVLAFAPTVLDDDVEAAADGFRPYLALYIGGMGAREMNFHFDVFCRMGYEAEATKIQALYLDGHKDDAAAAVPTAMVEDIALVGPAGEDPRRPGGLAGVDRHHPAGERGRGHPAHHGRAGRLNARTAAHLAGRRRPADPDAGVAFGHAVHLWLCDAAETRPHGSSATGSQRG